MEKKNGEEEEVFGDHDEKKNFYDLQFFLN